MFYLQLCEKFRIPSVRELLSRMTSEEVSELKAYYLQVLPVLDKQASGGGKKKFRSYGGK